MDKTQETIIMQISLFGLLFCAGLLIGYFIADGMPDVISLEEAQKTTIIQTEQRLCEKQTRALNREIDDCKEAQNRAFELVKDNYGYYDEFSKELTALKEEIISERDCNC